MAVITLDVLWKFRINFCQLPLYLDLINVVAILIDAISMLYYILSIKPAVGTKFEDDC